MEQACLFQTARWSGGWRRWRFQCQFRLWLLDLDGFDHILCVAHQLRAIADQHIATGGAGIKGVPGDSQNLAVLVQCIALWWVGKLYLSNMILDDALNRRA